MIYILIIRMRYLVFLKLEIVYDDEDLNFDFVSVIFNVMFEVKND